MIDAEGHLIVNQANLDRDPPNENRLSFQVFVRELIEDDPKSSRPVTITVNLRDVNDNAPILEPVRDISLVAGNTKRNIAKHETSDSVVIIFPRRRSLSRSLSEEFTFEELEREIGRGSEGTIRRRSAEVRKYALETIEEA